MDKKEKLDKIIEGCVRKDRASQEKLFKHFYSRMLVVCMRYTSDRDTAEELLQNGFIKVFEKLDKYEDTGSFEGWVKRIMVNTCIDFYRKSKKDPVQIDEDESFKVFDENTSEFDLVDFEELNTQTIMNAISELSPAYRNVFNLYVLENLSHKDIAERLGISEGTSKSNLAKARFNLQKALKGKLKGNDKYK